MEQGTFCENLHIEQFIRNESLHIFDDIKSNILVINERTLIYQT